MKAGYTVVDAVMSWDKLIEVINRSEKNEVVHLGWISPTIGVKCKSSETVGFWKIKQLKN